MEKRNEILDLSFDFALMVIRFCELLENKRKYVIARQLLKSGTSIGANIREVQGAESKADFFTNLKLLIKKPKKQNIGTFMSTFYRLSF